MAAPESQLRNSPPPRNYTESKKFVYTDADVHEHPPEGNSAPVIAFPGDDATNKAVKAYLLDVLTKTGWGLAVKSAQEIRATINSFVGNGWALRNRYTENRLQNICPLQIAAIEDGVAIKRKVSTSVRYNIGKCIMREMQRYFEVEDKTRDDPQHSIDVEDTLVDGLKESGTNVRQRQSNAVEPDEPEVQQFRKRPLSRATLPDEWMSESLRARTKSRQSQSSEDRPPSIPKPIQIKHEPVYISKTSAYPMLVELNTKPERAKSIKNTNYNGSQPGERRPASGISNVGTPTSKRNGLSNPHHTIPGSSLPRPVSSFGFRSVSRATIARRTELGSEPAQSLVGDTGNVASCIIMASDVLAELPPQTEVEEVDDDANEDGEATSHATPPNKDGHDGPANVPMIAEHLATNSPDDNKNTGDTASTTETDEHSTTVSPNDNKDAGKDTPIRPTGGSPKPPQTPRSMSLELEHRIQTFPSPASQPMPTLPPSPPNVYKILPPDLDTIAPGLPISGPDKYGNIATINDIPVGSKTRRIAEREVEEARAQTGEATAARQQVALTKGKGRLRMWFRRVWGKVKMRKHGRPAVAERA